MKATITQTARALLTVAISSLSLTIGCDNSSVVSVARLQIHLLDDTMTSSPRGLPASGRMTITPYDVHSDKLSATAEFALSSGVGELPELPIGRWRFMISGEGGGFKFYGGTGEFEINDNEAREIHAIVGQEQCTGLLPSMPVPQTHPFATQASPDIPRESIGSAIAELPNGQILITGGGAINAEGALVSVHNRISIYDPEHGLIFPTGKAMINARAYHQATPLNDGRILITGGYTGMGQPTITAELIALDANGELQVTTNSALQIAVARAHHAALTLNDGTVLVTGGIGANGAPLDSVTRFYPNDNTFRAQGPMSKARAYHAMAAIERSTEPAIITGGLTAEGPTASIEMFTTRTNIQCMRNTPQEGCFIGGGNLEAERWGHVALRSDVLPNAVLIAGGFSAGTQPQPTALASSIEVFYTQRTRNTQNIEVELPNVKSIGVLSVPRAHLSGARLFDDTLLLVGGEDLAGNSLREVTTIQLRSDGANNINPSVNSRCPLSEGRSEPRVLTTRDGGAIIMGGRRKGSMQAESGRVEMFYPSPPSLLELFNAE